ncbi:SAM-dependent methyltransferase [Paenibacillus eucommiae]|uniref:23S rRNA (Cytidine2498-2'-O)-methyltransferase n=1 Tax=Paenibacillus eucommiae TaxID=1355755 RepID=A0ABS4J943_9BACL|nr:SAM-dependent methyltransferase [Paenibacillus eucommiae]MBP1995234.1 23S rRNA (cytidine2498-2'-O)-methyltransferase [Paenibacillus eucommiae]
MVSGTALDQGTSRMTSTTTPSTGSRFIGTSNHGYCQHAQEELKRLFPEIRYTLLIPTEVFLFEVPVSAQEAVELIKQKEPMFLRHIQPVDFAWEGSRSDTDLDNLVQWLQQNVNFSAGEKIAVQVRKEERSQAAYTPFSVKQAIDGLLTSVYGAEPVVKEAERIISVYVTATKFYAGISRPKDNLSDWAGGAIRFHKNEEQISRAQFKLLEAEQRFELDFSSYHLALDIGAAPGGWTSLLLERGLRVTAIDPANMHPTLIQHPRLTFLKKNAGDVKLKKDEFDLLVCDMSWDPKQMARLVSDLLYAVKSGGTLIITVKLMHKKPFQTVRELLHMFGSELLLVKAKQLFHNREELTLYMLKQTDL